jgi:hypothetical protein
MFCDGDVTRDWVGSLPVRGRKNPTIDGGRRAPALRAGFGFEIGLHMAPPKNAIVI